MLELIRRDSVGEWCMEELDGEACSLLTSVMVSWVCMYVNT